MLSSYYNSLVRKVTELEWIKFIQATKAAKKAKGDKWMQSLLSTLRKNIGPSNAKG